MSKPLSAFFTALAPAVCLWHNTIIMSRWVRFLLAIGVGIGVGLIYGWILNPIEYVNTTPDSLRIDYKTDYVLMVAETYQVEADPALALQRLSLLGSPDPAELAYQAILFAQRAGYTDADLVTLRALADELQALQPAGQPLITP